MLTTAIEQSDRLDATLDGLRRRQQLDPGPAFAVLRYALDLIEVDQRDHTPLVADIAHESWRVGKDQQTLGLEGRGDLHGEAVAIDIDGDAVIADRGRGDNRQVAVIDQQAQELRLDPLDAATVIAMEDLDLVALLDAQVRLSPSDRGPAVHRRESHRARTKGAKPL